MVTRKATLLDLAKLGQILNNEDLVIEWLKLTKADNKKVQALITVENHELKYAMLNILQENTINNFLTYAPDQNVESIKFLINRSKEYFEKEGFSPDKFVTQIDPRVASVWEQVGFKAVVVSGEVSLPLKESVESGPVKESQESSQ